MSILCWNCRRDPEEGIITIKEPSTTPNIPLCISCFTAFEWGFAVADDGDDYEVLSEEDGVAS